jgi:glycosyltransferase involved in cell wall biosynthesis
MRILFLNQYFPPDPAPTGILLHELADMLQANGHSVRFVAARQDYRGGQPKGGRMLRELKALATMLLDGFRAPRADLVISASSPPLLLIVATLVALRHRAKSIHWIMDLYPEIAVALEEIPPGFFAQALKKIMGWCYRRADRVVVLDADMAERLEGHGVTTELIRPWGFRECAAAARAHRRTGGAVDVDLLGKPRPGSRMADAADAQALLEQRGIDATLLFQGGGPSWPAAQARAAELGLRNCAWKPYVPEEEIRASLLRCHVCAVTQKPSAQGLLWPSKLGLVMTLPRPILWVGPVDGAIARELRQFPDAGIFSPGNAEAIAGWLARRREEDLAARSHTRSSMLRAIAKFLWQRGRRWWRVFERMRPFS